MNDEVLIHHGVKGQRWGVITKQYVPKGTHSASKSLDASAKKGSKIQQRAKNRLAKRRQAKVAKRQAKLAKKMKNNKKVTTADDVWNSLSTEQKKQMVLNSKSAKALSKNADLFDYQELNNAYNRLILEKKISDMVPKEKSQGQKYLDVLETSTKYLTTTANALSAVNKVYGAATGTAKMLNKLSEEENKK